MEFLPRSAAADKGDMTSVGCCEMGFKHILASSNPSSNAAGLVVFWHTDAFRRVAEPPLRMRRENVMK
ncbi:hypothetical protein CDEST_08481 [Colletotrichum destructivum]|uniref:Uncharacterized protein n=1 Tax=Colletotrichum destructivum TaxID=34406 RepID=A0AAX4IJM6_9PEZI|nr:hypothetical protein CDEST_08481 [Colletotrichum destructivum]